MLGNPLHIGVKRLHLSATFATSAGQIMLDREKLKYKCLKIEFSTELQSQSTMLKMLIG